jgi:ABC-type cobalamin/Fe3+-siderophores transport system ATPase subunit
MEFKQFFVQGLFGLYNHTIDFAASNTQNKRASIIMLFGKNGIGKTTILRMIEGLMKLDFNVFREIKFNNAYLKFSNDETISVASIYNKQKELQYLRVKYKDVEVLLNPKEKGPLDTDKERASQVKIAEKYRTDMLKFNFEFIDTERLMKINLKEEEMMVRKSHQQEGKIGQKVRGESGVLAEKVKKFITESQVYSARFFAKDEPELFEKILSSIDNPSKINVVELKKRITAIAKAERDFQIKRLGIATEKWDKVKLTNILNSEQRRREPSVHKLTVINSYLEVLASRNNEKTSLAERLLIFESILNNFLMDKEISVSGEKGFEIKSANNNELKENQLSTGEYHLLYLTVLALCTTVQGTVIAIDEPEMSMHISWQNKLINALLQISSKANPQYIFATHSPDIAATYSNSLKTVTYGKK